MDRIGEKGKSNEYITYFQNDTFKKTAALDGFIVASILKRETGNGVEFLII